MGDSPIGRFSFNGEKPVRLHRDMPGMSRLVNRSVSSGRAVRHGHLPRRRGGLLPASRPSAFTMFSEPEIDLRATMAKVYRIILH
jgi:hypothetical protein